MLANVVIGLLGALPVQPGRSAQETAQAGRTPGSGRDRHHMDDAVDHADIQRVVGLQPHGLNHLGRQGDLPAVAQADC